MLKKQKYFKLNKYQFEYFINILTTMVGSLNDLSSLLNKNILGDDFDDDSKSNEEIEENEESKNSDNLTNERDLKNDFTDY